MAVILVEILLLFITLILIVLMRQHSTKSNTRYPKFIDCKQIITSFKDKKQMEEFAKIDKKYTRIDPPRPLGHYQCYCQEFSKLMLSRTEDDLCYHYYRDHAFASGEKYFVSIIIIVMNIILRTVCIKLTEKVGYEQNSLVIGRVTIFVTMI